MSMYIRKFLTDPGNDVLLEIESVNVLDLEPPSVIQGTGTGTAMMVGEFENGPFNIPTEVTSGDDVKSVFGLLGYTRAGVEGNDPSARIRYADNAVVGEEWNGNGHVQLSGKKFRRLILVRADTSVGSVELRRRAHITGNGGFSFDLEPGQILQLSVDGGAAASATFNATAGTVTGVGATFGTIAAGDTVTLGYDDANATPNFTVTFLTGDTTVAAVVARINAFAGFTFADANGGQLRLTGRRRGTSGQVRVVSGSTGVLTKLGLTAATTAGTGNVANIDAVTPAEVKSVVEAGIAGSAVEVDPNGKLRISSQTEATGSIAVSAGTTALNLGFTSGQSDAAAAGNAGVIPAGTVVQNSGATVVLVTMQDVVVTAANPGPYTVKVRHANDNGTGGAAAAGTITVIRDAIAFDSFEVINPTPISVALTESQIDAAYDTAIESTMDLNSIAREANIFWSARQSNAVRRKLRQNAIDASALGMVGRVVCIRPPMGTSKATAQSTSAEPGVGATRDQRVFYCFPQARTMVPIIARRGIGGGTGFTADGNVDVGADGFLASVLSQLNPEQNPGEETSFMTAVVSTESKVLANQKLTMADYTNFKKSGIVALRVENGVAVFQSGVTSVDPTVNPGLKNINRRRMADFIEDSIAQRSKGFGKKLNTPARRLALVGEVREFLQTLLSRDDPSRQRIAGFTVDVKSGNTATTLAQGIYRITVRVRTLSTLDSIVIAATVGETVEVEEILPEAA